MKYFCITIMLMLIPLILMGNLFTAFSWPGQSANSGYNSFDRTWRLNSLLEDNYSAGQWVTNLDYRYVYSNQYPARLDTLKMYRWENENWLLTAVTNYTYDNTQEYITQTLLNAQHEGVWQPGYKSTFTYDNQHRLIYAKSEMYDTSSSSWFLAGWTKIDFVSITNYTAWQYSAIDQNRIPTWIRMDFSWDTQGRVTGETDLVSTDSLTWTNLEQYTRTYHPHDTTTGDIFISNLSHYMPSQTFLSSDASEFNMFGMLTEELNTSWNGSSWVYLFKGNYIYNAQDKVTEFNEQRWNNNIWNNNVLTAYDYDTNANLSQVVISYNQNGNMTPDKRYVKTWGQPTANGDDTMPSIKGLNLIASPNPFDGDVTLTVNDKSSRLSTLQVYNMKGQLVRTLSTSTKGATSWDGKDVNGNSVANGIYLVKGACDGQSISTKVMKIR